jgi:hypothetical protein
MKRRRGASAVAQTPSATQPGDAAAVATKSSGGGGGGSGSGGGGGGATSAQRRRAADAPEGAGGGVARADGGAGAFGGGDGHSGEPPLPHCRPALLSDSPLEQLHLAEIRALYSAKRGRCVIA